jgi:2-amino-4-hydroxy-6-hydroxymethyldihydropteridine diphosphokinase
MVEAHIGLGSNLGDRRENLRYALDRLEQESCRVKKISSLYETDAVDCPGGKFLNAVALIETALAPDALLKFLLKVEQERGRTRSATTEARTLDLDLLLYGQEVITTEGLTIPHPRMHERAFVLIPLAEVSPDLQHPVLSTPMSVLADEAPDKETVSLLEHSWFRSEAAAVSSER